MMRGEFVDVLHQPVVLGAGPRDADRVAFLEGVGADQRGRHLAGQADQRDRIHQRVLQRRHRIGGARARGHQHDAGLAGRARIAFRRMAGALLVAHQDVLDLVLLENLVVDRKDRAAGIAEDMLDAIVLQRLHHHFGARHFAPLALSVAHRSGPVLSARHLGDCWSFSRVSGNKKGPRGSLCLAHGRISPGGYTALPTRFPTTRMSAVFMVADNRIGFAPMSTGNVSGRYGLRSARHIRIAHFVARSNWNRIRLGSTCREARSALLQERLRLAGVPGSHPVDAASPHLASSKRKHIDLPPRSRFDQARLAKSRTTRCSSGT